MTNTLVSNRPDVTHLLENTPQSIPSYTIHYKPSVSALLEDCYEMEKSLVPPKDFVDWSFSPMIILSSEGPIIDISKQYFTSILSFHPPKMEQIDASIIYSKLKNNRQRHLEVARDDLEN